MVKYLKIVEILICLQSIFISAMIPIFIELPYKNNLFFTVDLPITFQLPNIILISIFFKRYIVFSAFTIYLLLGLFALPIFHQGGSLGYMLTPNFGYLLGIYPLISIMNNLSTRRSIRIFDFLKRGTLAVFAMHLTGIVYSFIQTILYKKFDLFLYNVGNYSLGKIGYHIFLLIPLVFLIKPIDFLRTKKK